MEEKKVDEIQEKKQNDLSDIVLEKTDIKADKVKKILLSIASLILLFLIVLVVMKMLNQQDKQDGLEELQIVEENVALKNTEQPLPEEQKEEDETIFKQIPILDENENIENAEKDTNEKFEEMVRKLKEQEELKSKPVEVVDSKIDKLEKDLQNVKASPEVEKKLIEEKPTPKEIIVATKELPKASSKKASKMSGYFVQVGATYGSYPSKNFLTKIKNQQYNYIIHKVVINGRDVRKVLVGPYSSRNSAQRALAELKQKINHDAFIYRLK